MLMRLNVSQARAELAEVVNRAAYGNLRTIVSRRGKDLAVVIPVEDLRVLEHLAPQEMDGQDLKDSVAARARKPKRKTPMRRLGD
jgi:prevent-host-death family protein